MDREAILIPVIFELYPDFIFVDQDFCIYFIKFYISFIECKICFNRLTKHNCIIILHSDNIVKPKT